ncbi:MAG: DUF2294 domain-containing protein [bacterium]
MRTKGQVEAQISEALVKFEKEYMGRGPYETKTFIMGDMVLVRLKGVLTLAEQQLAKSGPGNLGTGKNLIKQVRMELLEKARPILEKIIQKTTGASVVSLHTDVSTVTGERIIIFTLDRDLPFTNSPPRKRE